MKISMHSFYGASSGKSLRRIILALSEIEEVLMAGLVPTRAQWEGCQGFAAPWGDLICESLERLRASGGALLPTLKRIKQLAHEEEQALMTARVKTSQAVVQALICMSFVPLLSLALYGMLPVLHSHFYSWLGVTFVGAALAILGAVWLFKMTEGARWGGVRLEYQSWLLGSQCAGERFLALIRTGMPPDLAWAQMMQFLQSEIPTLSRYWGVSLWNFAEEDLEVLRSAEKSMAQVGTAFKKAIQVSLIEGRPCLERVESILFSLRLEMRSHVDRQLALLATRALQPLFCCVAPGLLGLLAYSFWLVGLETMTEEVFSVF